jgi:ubiquinone/menaquinone biosynthesis C-methylase UbiE
VATDLSPQMVEWGKARMGDDGFEFEWLEADAEALPFDDGRFDVVASTFGAMFGPRPELVAAEMFRVARPGGLVAMANWTPEGYSGQSSAAITRFAPPFPDPLPSPMLWGIPDEVRMRFAGLAASVEFEKLLSTFEFESIDAGVDFFMDNTGAFLMLQQMLPAEKYAELRGEIEDHVRRFSRPEGDLWLLENEYLVVLARKP